MRSLLISLILNSYAFQSLASAEGIEVPVITFALVGDVFLGSAADLSLSLELNAVLQKSQFKFGNLEGPICDTESAKRECRGNQATCYFNKMPSSVSEIFKNWGIDAFSLANNHVFDYGQKCFEETKVHLSKVKIQYSGEKGTVAKFKYQGLNIVFIAFHSSPWANDIYDFKSSFELIRLSKNKNDIVIVSIHAGAEGAKAKVLPPNEEFDFGERRGNINLFAKKAIEAGADIVFGHGPHVLRKIEIYKKKIIAYSLGNFATTPGFNLMDEQKYGLILLVKINYGGNLVEAQIIPTVQNLKTKFVELDSSQFAIQSIRKLSQKKLVGHDGKIR